MREKTLLVGLLGFLAVLGTANSQPQAQSQVLYGRVGEALPIVLSAHDPDGDPLQFEILSPPLHGVLQGIAPNLQYFPNPGFEGKDRFTFSARDPYGGFDIGFIEIVISSGIGGIKILPTPSTDFATTNLITFLMSAGVTTWYVIDPPTLQTVVPGTVPFVFIGKGSEPRLFVVGLKESPKVISVPCHVGVNHVDLHGFSPGVYMFLVIDGAEAFSFPFRIVSPPQPLLAFGG